MCGHRSREETSPARLLVQVLRLLAQKYLRYSGTKVQILTPEELLQEMMLLAGEAAAQYAARQYATDPFALPFLYRAQISGKKKKNKEIKIKIKIKIIKIIKNKLERLPRNMQLASLRSSSSTAHRLQGRKQN